MPTAADDDSTLNETDAGTELRFTNAEAIEARGIEAEPVVLSRVPLEIAAKGAMLMSLLVLRVLDLIFDKMARGLYVICVRVLRMNPTSAATLLGLSDVPVLQEE